MFLFCIYLISFIWRRPKENVPIFSTFQRNPEQKRRFQYDNSLPTFILFYSILYIGNVVIEKYNQHFK